MLDGVRAFEVGQVQGDHVWGHPRRHLDRPLRHAVPAFERDDDGRRLVVPQVHAAATALQNLVIEIAVVAPGQAEQQQGERDDDDGEPRALGELGDQDDGQRRPRGDRAEAVDAQPQSVAVAAVLAFPMHRHAGLA